MNPTISYFLCATPRSGSTLLCQALKNTGLAGHPREHFNPAFYHRDYEKYAVSDVCEYVTEVVRSSTTPNGVFGTKMNAGGFVELFADDVRKNDPSLADTESVLGLMEALFPNLHYVFVTRRNKVRQAVSNWRALTTGAWQHRADQTKQEESPAEYDFRSIDHLYNEISMREALWQEYFSAGHPVSCTVVYEDFALDPLETVRRVLTSIGVESDEQLSVGKITLLKMADSTSEEWITRYRKDKQSGWPIRIW